MSAPAGGAPTTGAPLAEVAEGARPDLSVVIPARDVASTLAEQLDALLAQSWSGRIEVVVVDNRSTDTTAELAHDYAERDRRVRVVEAFSHVGLCYARAVGVEAAAGDAIAICDGDDVVGSRWVTAMGEGLRSHPCVTGPLEVDRLNPAWLAASRGRPSRTECATWFGLFPLVSGGNLGLRREVWRRVGGFDEHFLGAEDAEFSLRLHLHGIPVHFDPEALVHYRYRDEPGALWRQGTTYGRGRPLVRRRVKAAALNPPPALAGWKSWAWLAVHAPDTVTRAGRARWVWVAGNRLGQLRGSVRARTLFV